MKTARAVLFDLDGTLADTAPDMGAALNRILGEEGREPLAAEQIRPHVSAGAPGLLRLGFGADINGERLESLRQRFLDIYASALSEHTVLFPGMAETLERLEAAGKPWGIVTNKPHRYTLPVLEGLGVRERAACIISGDTLSERKPHPAPVLHACQQLGLSPLQCLFVGDDRRDVMAGRAAGTINLVAMFGYLGGEGHPREWFADGFIEHPLELLDWLEATA